MDKSMDDKTGHVQETLVVQCVWKAAMGEGKIMRLESLFRAGLSKSYVFVEAVGSP